MDETLSNSDITAVLTSCGRFHLLEKTLGSFFQFCTVPLAGLIIIDDSGLPGAQASILAVLGRCGCPDIQTVVVLANPVNIGQARSINRAYKLVRTKYIFHLEDDWEFLAPGFMEESMQVLEATPWVMTHWLRDRSDTNGHPVEQVQGLDFGLMALSYVGCWHGFTLNPGLRRTADFFPIESEPSASVEFMRRGFRASITGMSGGYVRHIGGGEESTAFMPGTAKA